MQHIKYSVTYKRVAQNIKITEKKLEYLEKVGNSIHEMIL